MKNKMQLPITHFQLNEELDSRFSKVKVWIAHTGENLNGTIFSKEALLNMAKTLPYVPILGFIEKDEFEKEDFKDHMQTITLNDDSIEIEFHTIPCGFIPVNPNAQIEYRLGKEYLTCEGYLWNRFTKAINLFKENDGRKSQSMEIEIGDVFVDEYGRTNVTSGRFTGLCILGNNVPPAMIGASVDLYSMSNIKKQMQEMILEFSTKEGESTLENNDLIKDEVVEEVEISTEEVETETEQPVESTESESEVETESSAAEETEVFNETEETEETTKAEENETETESEIEELEELLETVDLEETEDNSIEEQAEVTFATDDEVAKLKQRIEELEKELSEANQAIGKYELSEKQTILNNYSNELSKEAFESFKGKLGEYNKEDLEKDIVFSIYSSNKSKDKAENVQVYSYTITNEQQNNVESLYGSVIGSYFTKR